MFNGLFNGWTLGCIAVFCVCWVIVTLIKAYE